MNTHSVKFLSQLDISVHANGTLKTNQTYTSNVNFVKTW
jgi:hypothetical protein